MKRFTWRDRWSEKPTSTKGGDNKNVVNNNNSNGNSKGDSNNDAVRSLGETIMSNGKTWNRKQTSLTSLTSLTFLSILTFYFLSILISDPLYPIHYQNLTTLSGGGCVTPDIDHPRGIVYVCQGSRIKRWDSYGGRWMEEDLIETMEGTVLDIEIDRRSPSYYFYISYLTTGGDLQIDRYNRGGVNVNDPEYTSLILNTKVAVLTVEYTGRGNPGGILSSWQDLNLTVSIFDNGGGMDAGNPSSPYGKIFRIDPTMDGFPGDDRRNYTIPFDNPFNTEVLFYGVTHPRYKLTGGGNVIVNKGQIIDAWVGSGVVTPPLSDLRDTSNYPGRVDMGQGGVYGSMCANGTGGDVVGGFYNWIDNTPTWNKFIFAACGEWWVSERRNGGGFLTPSRLGLPYIPTVNVSSLGWKGYPSLLYPEGLGRMITTITDPPAESNAIVMISGVGDLESIQTTSFYLRTRVYVCNRKDGNVPLSQLNPTVKMTVYRYQEDGEERGGLEQVATLDWNPSPISIPTQSFVACPPTGSSNPVNCGSTSGGNLPRNCRAWIETPAIPFDPSLNTRYILEIGLVEDYVTFGPVRWGSVRFRIPEVYRAEKEGSGAFHAGKADEPIYQDGFESGSVDYFQ